MTSLGSVVKTERGFEVIEFMDSNLKKCSLQQSSAICFSDDRGWDNPGSSFVWLGIDEPKSPVISTRMHLNREKVQGLVERLQQWLETGGLQETAGDLEDGEGDAVRLHEGCEPPLGVFVDADAGGSGDGEELRRLKAAREALEKIVCTEGVDRGLILVDHESPTRYDAEMKCQVYVHENFSPLGDALIALWDLLADKRKGVSK